jgi:hypothetical protein
VTTNQFKSTLHAEPFVPFVVHLADGRSIPVKHREFAMLAPSGRTVVIYQPDDTMNLVDLLLVTDLETQVGTAKRRRRGTNGS